MSIHQFSLPAAFNGEQFINDSKVNDVYVREDVLFIDSDKSRDELKAFLDSHNPATPTESSVSDKLASVGLSIEDLKAVLGL